MRVLSATLSAGCKETLQVEKTTSCSFRKQHSKEDDIATQITRTLSREKPNKGSYKEVTVSGWGNMERLHGEGGIALSQRNSFSESPGVADEGFVWTQSKFLLGLLFWCSSVSLYIFLTPARRHLVTECGIASLQRSDSDMNVCVDVHPWIFTGRTDAEAEAPILWPPDAKSRFIGKDPDAGKDRAGGEKGARGWDGRMVSLTQWTWVWANARRQWRTGKLGMLQSLGSQRVGHDLVTKQQQQQRHENT